ncbi:MAG: translation initiation factor IF-2 [Spirochaetales bacterium]
MSTVNNNNENSKIDNLRQLAQILTSNQVAGLLKEVRNAKYSLEDLNKQVLFKERTILDKEETAKNTEQVTKVEKVNVEVAKTESVPTVTPTNRAPQNRDSRPPYNKPYDGEKKPYEKRPFEGKPYEKRPFENKPYEKKPFERRPFDRNTTGGDSKDKFAGKPYPNRDGKAPYRPAAKPEVAVEETVEVVKNKFALATSKQKDDAFDKKPKNYSKKQLLRRGLIEEKEIEERMLNRRLKVKRPKQMITMVQKPVDRAVITTENISVKLLAETIGKPVTEIIKKLFEYKVMATINSNIDYDTAELVALDLGITLEKKVEKTFEEKLQDQLNDHTEDDVNLKSRPPIVAVMGHVDHGKTSLLDAIRETNVIKGEAGGITQHIGAYVVKTEKGKITFIDTPGHEAFSEMRARGAKITDVAILVVAADDGIMPQTIEAINHIKAADVPMIVAVNKIDKPTANVERVKQQLADSGVLAEEWGGDAIIVPVSAHTKEGINKLLEMILLVAEVKELKANPQRNASGTVIEAKLDKGQGPVATIIVQDGTLKVGDTIVSGLAIGRIRAMMDENGKAVKKALPSTPVAVLGLDSVPQAGDFVHVVDEKMSKQLIEERKENVQRQKNNKSKVLTAEDLFGKDVNKKKLNVIVKGSVMGSVEALKQSLLKIKNDEAEVAFISGGAGAINENDVLLAQTANAIIIGFNVMPDVNARKLADKTGVDIRFYDIIYNVIDDFEAMIKTMLAPKFEEVIIGHAEVRVLYKISKIGTIFGCIVKDGKITRNSKVRVLRKDNVIATASIETLRIQKDDVKEVKLGFEFGIKLANYNDAMEGDILEAFVEEQVKA